MSTKPATRIECDGECGAFLYGPTAAEVRALAADAGWTRPHQRRLNGQPASRRSDVCPKCAATFTPKMSRTTTEWAGMPPEQRRLKTFLRMNWNLISREERERLEAKLAGMQGRPTS